MLGRGQNALKCFVRMRDYCNDSKAMLGMCMHVIQVSLEIPQFMHMTNHITKAENLPDVVVGSLPPSPVFSSSLSWSTLSMGLSSFALKSLE